MTKSADNPVMVEVTRGPATESRHRGAAAVIDSGGQLVAAWGDTARPVYPRSAIKPLQAIPLIESGAAEAHGVTDEEIALACASHSGEPVHVRRVTAWLERIGLGPDALECGPHAPTNAAAAEALVRAGAQPTRVHNNCSGKHAGMLTTALHLGDPISGYTDPGHPVQTRIRGLLEEMGSCDLSDAPVAVDGCSVPTVAMPLFAIARAMALVAAPDRLPQGRRDAAERVRRAMAAHPYLVGGERRFDSELMARIGDRALTKIGGEGVFAAAVPGRSLGIAVKIDDGAGRAAEVAVAAILRYLDVLGDDDWSALSGQVAPRLFNHAGVAVGTVRTAEGWPA